MIRPLMPLALLAATSAPLLAQSSTLSPSLVCATPAQPSKSAKPCAVTVTPGQVDRNFALDLVGPRTARTPVAIFYNPSAGAVSGPAARRGPGAINFRYRGVVDVPVTIEVTAEFDRHKVTRHVLLQPRAAPADPLSIAAPFALKTRYWFTEGEIPGMVEAEIRGATPATCASTVVVFSPAAGAVRPAETNATWDPGAQLCVARTRWSLGKEIGHHVLSASIKGSKAPPVQFPAVARKKAGFFGGIALTQTREYYTLTSSFDTVVVETPTDGGGKRTTREFVPQQGKKRLGGLQTNAVIGVHTPLWPSLPRWRLSVGADAGNLDGDWYFGFSFLQVVQGVSQEGLPIDLQLVAHLSRRNILRNPTCVDEGSTETCLSESETRFVGAGFLLVVDAGDLLKTALGALK